MEAAHLHGIGRGACGEKMRRREEMIGVVGEDGRRRRRRQGYVREEGNRVEKSDSVGLGLG